MGGARGDMRAGSGHRRQRALEERRHDGLHAVCLVLGERAVELPEGVLREAAAHDCGDAFGGRERGVQDEDLDVGIRLDTVPVVSYRRGPAVPVGGLGASGEGRCVTSQQACASADICSLCSDHRVPRQVSSELVKSSGQ